MFGGFNFGQNPAQTGAPTTGGFSFGAGTGTTIAAAQPTGFNFGGTATNPNTAAAPTQNTGFTGFGLASTAAASSQPAATQPATAGGGFGGFSFGGAAATKPATAGFSFGLGQPAVQTSQAPAATGFNFGGATQTAATTVTPGAAAITTATAAKTGFGATGFFGMKAPASTVAATTATSATAGAPVMGGFSGFGSAPTASTGGSVLGGLLAAPTTAAAQTLATTSAPSGFSLGTAAAPSSSTAATGLAQGSTTTQTSTAPTLSGGLGLGGLTGLAGFGSSSQSTGSTATATTTASTAIAPSLGGAAQKQMTFRQLEDTINKWTTELEDQERYFLDQATQVNAWDRIVMENGEKIIQLSKDVERVKLDQQKLDHELDFVRSQQKELEELLDPLEKALDGLPPLSQQQHAHLERELTYTLAESLDSQLKRMGQDLKEIVERLNSNSSKPESSDPVQQITKILNAHVVSLMWVDRNSADLQRRVEEIGKLMESEKREQERNFRLAYS